MTNSVCSLCCDGCKEHGERVERDRIIKIIEAYGNPNYAEAWRPYIEEACNRLIALIKGEK